MTQQSNNAPETVILHCPFCNSRAYPGTTYSNKFIVYCDAFECGNRTHSWDTKEAAILAWNRRAPLSSSQEQEHQLDKDRADQLEDLYIDSQKKLEKAREALQRAFEWFGNLPSAPNPLDERWIIYQELKKALSHPWSEEVKEPPFMSVKNATEYKSMYEEPEKGLPTYEAMFRFIMANHSYIEKNPSGACIRFLGLIPLEDNETPLEAIQNAMSGESKEEGR